MEFMIDESEFFQSIGYRILNRTRTDKQLRYLLSEENTRYENFGEYGDPNFKPAADGNEYGDSKSKYHYKSAYQVHKCFSVALSETRSVTLGAGLSGGYMGAAVGGNVGLRHDRTTTRSSGEGYVQTKELVAEGEIDSGKYVIVRELEYLVETEAEYDLQLKVGGKILYTCDGKDKKRVTKRVSVDNLCKTMTGVKLDDEGVMYAKVTATCTSSEIEHTLEILTRKCDDKRAEEKARLPETVDETKNEKLPRIEINRK